MFDRLQSGLWQWLPRALTNGLTTIGLLAMILGTAYTVDAPENRFLFATVVAVWGCIATDFIVQLWTAPTRPMRHAYLASAEGLIDLAAVIALPLGWLLAPDPRHVPLFAVVWTLRYIRHTTGLAL